MPKISIFHQTPDAADIKSAQNYLELLFPENEAAEFAKKLRTAKVTTKKAKDILRASELELLPIENQDVNKNLNKARKKQKMSPIMLVCGREKLIVADGFHRLCAAYYLGEEIEIPCLLV